jgi:nucleoside-diphosphate-sugar epimerase
VARCVTTIAVTGASGFVGRHFVRAASRAGHAVRGLVRSETGARAVRDAGGSPVALADDPAALAEALAGCGAVVHLAQIGAERDGQTYEAVNISLTERVVLAARRADVPRLVSFSGLGVARYGLARRTSSRYFLSKLTAETIVFRSGLDAVVFRPSFVVGPGDSFVPAMLAAMDAGEVERPGDGRYRMQPIAVADAAALVLVAVTRPPGGFPTIFDLVGPVPVAYAALLERLAQAARGLGRPARLRVREVEIEEAERRARHGGFHGMGPDELDCLLCDEVSDPAPLVALLGRPLIPLDEALAAAVRAVPAGKAPAPP